MTLDNIVSNLETKKLITAIFLTGSGASSSLKDYSDYDLVIVLDKNEIGIKSVYTYIDGKFADIFFFTESIIKNLTNKKSIDPNSEGGILLNWLSDAKIKFDKTGSTSKLQDKVKKNNFKTIIPKDKVTSVWNKVNYNFICNQRYYQSQDELYLKALDIKLLHSVIELITSYFTFRQIPWQGEKRAISYLEAKDQVFYHKFQNFLTSKNIDERMKFYKELFNLTIPESLGRWDKDIIINTFEDKIKGNQGQRKGFWKNLINGS